MKQVNPIIQAIGEEEFRWLSLTFDRRTTLKDIPGTILDRLASVDITLRDYSGDANALTAIALITFAYTMAGRSQSARSGPKEILLAKILAKKERSRRQCRGISRSPLWEVPLLELIMGEVGDRIRAMPLLNSPA